MSIVQASASETITTCCIVGGGPAGVMLGYLLARGGVSVIVLEKHADFFRDFRGDTVHASTLDALERLGLLDDFKKLIPRKQTQLTIRVGTQDFPGPDFRFITARNKYLAFVAQWDFLNFLAERAKVYPSFSLEMNAEGVDLIRRGRRVIGVRAKTEQGERTILADLVVACDGRSSVIRERSALPLRDLGAPIDVLWFRMDKRAGDPPQTFGSIESRHFVVLIDRETYWQCAYVIPKGAFTTIRAGDIAAFQREVAASAPFLGDRISQLGWDDIKLLSVSVNRLQRWTIPGLLCIGDAAHAMSPVGGVGINLAIQDAIATANMVGPSLARKRPTFERCRAVQQRRSIPAILTQTAQVFAHHRLLGPIVSGEGVSLPRIQSAMRRFGFLRFLAAQAVGVGILPERPRFGVTGINQDRRHS